MLNSQSLFNPVLASTNYKVILDPLGFKLMMDIFGHVQSLISDKRCPIGVEVFMKSHFMIKPCRLIEIDKINNIARYSLFDTKYCQMVFRSDRWHFSRALFGNPWSIKSEW